MTAAKEGDATLDASVPSEADTGAGLRVGQRFAGRYEIERELGRGGMGVVFEAKDSMLDGERVALKMLFADAGPAIERFRREVLLARRISSPHVARTHDLGESGGRFFLTMELVAGESLGARLTKLHAAGARLPTSESVRIGRAIALGLAAAHEAGVVHRDLKPDNVLLGEDGRVVVTDFGIARAVAGPEAIRATQGIAGTPAYMAPEQLEGRSIDGRADLYALGVLLFECLSGELPFAGDTPFATAVARLSGEPRPLPPELGLPEELVGLVAALLARKPDDRPREAREVAARLEALVASGVVRAATPPVVARPTPGPTPAPAATPGSTATRGSERRAFGVVVLPFEHRGGASDAHVTEQVRGELVDLLSRTAGLRVVGGIDPGSDVRSFESRFGARFAVHAAVQVATGGTRLRGSLRLLEVGSGVQLGAETLELAWPDAFAAPELLAAKMAEALRLSVEVASAEDRVSPEALDAYRQARRGVRGALIQAPEAVLAHLDRAIALAPGFAPPLALAALAAARFSFVARENGPDYRAMARTALAGALDHAGHLPETRFAASAVAWHDLRLRDAVVEARAALALAPAYPEAIAFLGQLELEAGRPVEGLARLERARALEPTLRITVLEPARWHALYGELARFHELTAGMRDLREELLLAQYHVRCGAWRGDEAMIREGIRVLDRSTSPIAGPLGHYGRVVLGEAAPTFRTPSWMAVASPRLATITHQMIAEASAKVGQHAQALDEIEQAADIALTDLEWIDKCPFFAPLRDEPRFHAARERVVKRCEEIWLAT